jgi:hypothetical protein
MFSVVPGRHAVRILDTLPRFRLGGYRMAAELQGFIKPYNWHPSVHSSHFGETLYFAMIRLKEPVHVPVADQVRELLRSAGVEYACEYSLFGWHDALIRAWLTPSAYRRFVRVLPPGIRGLTVERIHYLWRSPHNLLTPDTDVLTAVAGAEKDIDYVADHPDSTNSDGWNALHRLGLVFDRPPTDGGVKFYTALERTSDTVSFEAQTEAILRAMNETPVPNSDTFMSASSSLYCGAGNLADYLVRCVVPTYNDVLTLAEAFDINLRDAHVRPMTLLVANPQPREYDYVNDPLHLSQGDTNLAEMLSVEPRILAKLDEHHRLELKHLVATACELADQDAVLKKLLLVLLQGTVINNYDQLYTSLTYLVQFEPHFGKRIVGILAIILGEESWFPQIKEECEANFDSTWRTLAKEMTEKKMSAWTLATYKFLALAAAEFHPGVRGRLESELGSHWANGTDSLHELRNDYTHGRIYDEFPRLDLYDKKWTDYLVRLMDAAVLARRCGQPAQREEA